MADPGLKRLDRGSLGAFRERLAAIDPGEEPRFGSLRPHRMIAHLVYMVELSLGEREAERDVGNPVTRSRLFWYLVMDWLPWPKGKVKAPGEFLPEPAGDFEQERRRLFEAMERFVAVLENAPDRRVHSPLLGPLRLSDWSRLHGKHFCHHLEQFGAL